MRQAFSSKTYTTNKYQYYFGYIDTHFYVQYTKHLFLTLVLSGQSFLQYHPLNHLKLKPLGVQILTVFICKHVSII